MEVENRCVTSRIDLVTKLILDKWNSNQILVTVNYEHGKYSNLDKIWLENKIIYV